MTRILLLEDEPPALQRLRAAVESHPATEVVGTESSVDGAYLWLTGHPAPDLIIADIELADGKAFRLFERWRPTCPVIFCTAFDEHVLEALGWNGIDYILKPIRSERIHEALDKYAALRQHFRAEATERLTGFSAKPRYRRRLLVKRGSEFLAIPVEKIAYLASEHKLTVAVLSDGNRHLLDRTLTDLESELDPTHFFRASRSHLLRIDAVEGFESAGKGRLEVLIAPRPGNPVIVSQKNAADFRAWLES